MPRKQEMLSCSETERKKLEWIISSNVEGQKVILRARMILAYLDGQPIAQIIRDFQVSKGVFFRWRDRFCRDGVNGLWDKPHPGKPPVYDAGFEQKVLELMKSDPPAGHEHWDGQLLAKVLDASGDAVWRVLRKNGISLVRKRVWRVPVETTQPKMKKQLMGAFIAPPTWLAVLTDGTAPLGKVQVVTHSREVKDKMNSARKNAPLSMMQAIEIISSVPGRTRDTLRFQAAAFFLETLAKTLDEDQEVQVLCFGDLPFPGAGTWQAEHPRFRFVYLPLQVNGTWNPESLLPPGVQREYMHLHSQLEDYPPDACPFVWIRE